MYIYKCNGMLYRNTATIIERQRGSLLKENLISLKAVHFYTRNRFLPTAKYFTFLLILPFSCHYMNTFSEKRHEKCLGCKSLLKSFPGTLHTLTILHWLINMLDSFASPSTCTVAYTVLHRRVLTTSVLSFDEHFFPLRSYDGVVTEAFSSLSFG